MGMGRMGEEDGCVRVPLPANETARVPTLCDRSVDEKAETTFAATAPLGVSPREALGDDAVDQIRAEGSRLRLSPRPQGLLDTIGEGAGGLA